MRSSFWLALVLVALSIVPRVRADDPARWLFVPVIAQQRELAPWLAGALDELAHTAEDKGVTIWPREDAAQAFERKHSSELSPVTPDDVASLERLSDSAVKSMAAQHHAAALHELDAAGRLYQRAPEEFNRLAPGLVLDMCLFRARALVESGEPVLRVKQGIRDCRLRIPLEIEPNLVTHTNPTVRKLLSEVSDELAASRTGRLTVRGPAGCPVRMDGVEVGRLRGGVLQFDNLLVGAHRVSVACTGVEPRIYTVTVTGAEAELAVDGALDSVLRSRPYLYLDVESTTPQAEVARVARVIATTLRDTHVVLARVTPQGPLVLRRLTPRGETFEAQIAAPAQLGEAWAPEQRTAAIEALLRPARSEAGAAPVGPVAQAEPAPGPTPPPLEARRGWFGDRELLRWQRASRGLLVLAGASTVTAMGLHFAARSVRGDRRGDYDDGNANDSAPVARARSLGAASLGLAPVGGVLLAMGLTGPSLRRVEYRRPNTALMLSLGAAGVGMLAASVYPFVRARDACAECAASRDNHTENGFLTAGTGLGLLAAPLFFTLFHYLPARSLMRAGRLSASAGVGPGGVSLGGTF